MRIHRFFLPDWKEQSDVPVLDQDLIHQWIHVFRMRVGDELVFCNGKNEEVDAKILRVEKKTVFVRLGKKHACQTELVRPVVLATALLKRENFEWVAQKATELGVTEIQPLVTDRTIKNDFKRTRVQAIVREAMEQSGRGVVPIVHEPRPLARFLENKSPSSVVICDGEGDSLPFILSKNLKDPLMVLIGPEGGWSEKERVFFKGHNFSLLRLGARTLRAETAAVSALAIVSMTIENPS